jgi:hypothetical protein
VNSLKSRARWKLCNDVYSLNSSYSKHLQVLCLRERYATELEAASLSDQHTVRWCRLVQTIKMSLVEPIQQKLRNCRLFGVFLGTTYFTETDR